MNRKLLDPFEPEYPETIEACLDDEYATKCAFSHDGTLLATARSDGQCYIWDMDTLNIVRKLRHSESALNGLSWSRNSRYMLTYDEAGLCIVWDLKTETKRVQFAFGSSINCAKIHPRNTSHLIVCPARETPCFVDISDDNKPPVIMPVRLSDSIPDLKSKAAASTCFCFGKKGVYAFFGTSKGTIVAIHIDTQSIAFTLKLSSSGINTISQNPHGTEIVTSSTDRIIRVCSVELPANPGTKQQTDSDTPSISVISKIQDIVNRVHWSQAVFSASGDYIVSGIEHKAEHNVYIWDKWTGSLVKMLTGPNELLEDCAVHPLRPIIASISTFGIIYLWTRMPQQNWNAFAPGFRELEENIDYVEPEGEFDKKIVDADGIALLNAEPEPTSNSAGLRNDAEGDVDYDVDITDDDPLFSDSDSEIEDDGFVLPVVVEEETGLGIESVVIPPPAEPAG